MDDFTAAVLILLTVLPAVAVLLVLIARGVREIWHAGASSGSARLQKAMERKVPFEGKLCGARS